MNSRLPKRGDIWLANLDPVMGHEQGGRRPVLVISSDLVNGGPSRLVIAIPVTSRLRGIPSHIQIPSGEGGLDRASAAMVEQMRSLTHDRLGNRLGNVTPQTLLAIESVIRRLLAL